MRLGHLRHRGRRDRRRPRPGRERSFAFETLPGFDPAAWAALRAGVTPRDPAVPFYGFDRDAGAIRMAAENATRAGVHDAVRFSVGKIDALEPPPGPPGIVIVNPPYGTRIGNKAPLLALHRLLGTVLSERFTGWRVGIVTADKDLASVTRLPFLPRCRRCSMAASASASTAPARSLIDKSYTN